MKQTDCINCENISCLFKGDCSSKWIEQFRCKSGQHIFLEDMPVKGLYVVQDGAVNEYYPDKNGEKIIRHTAKSGEIFGYIDYSGYNHILSAVAIENTQICFIDRNTLYDACLNNAELSFKLLNFFLDELKKSDNRLTTLAALEQNGQCKTR